MLANHFDQVRQVVNFQRAVDGGVEDAGGDRLLDGGRPTARLGSQRDGCERFWVEPAVAVVAQVQVGVSLRRPRMGRQRRERNARSVWSVRLSMWQPSLCARPKSFQVGGANFSAGRIPASLRTFWSVVSPMLLLAPRCSSPSHCFGPSPLLNLRRNSLGFLYPKPAMLQYLLLTAGLTSNAADGLAPPRPGGPGPHDIVAL